MKKSLLLLLAFVLATVTSYAQIQFENGYFISNDGTKSEVLIKNIDWKNNPKNFEYKATADAEAVSADASTVQEFSVGSFIFKRYMVRIDRATNDVDYMSNHQEPDFTTETLFLKVLATGDATLYSYEDGNLVRFFYSKGTGTPEQLVYKPYRNGTDILYNNSFRGQLYPLMSDKITDKDRYKSTKYDEKSLTKLFTEYNGNSAVQVKTTTTAGKRFHLKVTPGVDFIKAELHQTENNGNRYEFDTKPSFRMGIEAEIVLPVNKGKWAIFAEPYYTSYKQSNRDVYTTGIGAQYTTTMDLSFNYIAVPLGIRHYLFFNNNSSLFINASYTYAFAIGNSKATFVYEGAYTTTKLTGEATNGACFSLGTGYRYKRYSTEVRYNTNRELLANSAEWKSSISSVSIIFGYKIF